MTMESTILFEGNTELIMIVVLIAAVLSLVATVLSVWALTIVRKHHRGRTAPSTTARDAKNLADRLDSEFDERCRKVVLNVISEQRPEPQNIIVPAAENASAQDTSADLGQSEPEAPSFVPEHLFGEYSEQDKGFLAEDISHARGSRSQAEIDTISPVEAEFSIIPDVDSSIVSSLRDCCELEKGDWMNYRSIRTVSKGRLELKGNKWDIISKAKIILE